MEFLFSINKKDYKRGNLASIRSRGTPSWLSSDLKMCEEFFCYSDLKAQWENQFKALIRNCYDSQLWEKVKFQTINVSLEVQILIKKKVKLLNLKLAIKVLCKFAHVADILALRAPKIFLPLEPYKTKFRRNYAASLFHRGKEGQWHTHTWNLLFIFPTCLFETKRLISLTTCIFFPFFLIISLF